MGLPIPSEIWDKLIAAIASGLNETDSCDVVGIGRSTLHEKKKDPVFAERVRKAYASFKLTHVQNISKAAKTSWQASAWLLERKFPKEYGAQARLDITSGGKELKQPTWFGKAINEQAEDAVEIETKQVTDGSDQTT